MAAGALMIQSFVHAIVFCIILTMQHYHVCAFFKTSVISLDTHTTTPFFMWWNMAVIPSLSWGNVFLCPIRNTIKYIIVSLCCWRKAKLWSGCSHIYIWVSRIIIISLHVSLDYLQQMFGNWFCIIHQTICYSFTLYLFCFLWIEHTQNECSESFITCQWTELMRDMKAFYRVLCFGALKPSTTYFCSLYICIWSHQS